MVQDSLYHLVGNSTLKQVLLAGVLTMEHYLNKHAKVFNIPKHFHYYLINHK